MAKMILLYSLLCVICLSVIVLAEPVSEGEWEGFFDPFGDSQEAQVQQTRNLSITSNPEEWIVTKYTDVESNSFNVSQDLVGSNNTRICLLPKFEISVNEDIVKDMKIFVREGEQNSLIEKTGDTEIEKEGGNLKKLCYTIDQSLYDYLQFGNNTIIVEYQNINTIVYEDGEGRVINHTLSCEGMKQNDVFVFYNNKFGANVTTDANNITCTYQIKSNTNLKKIDDFLYYNTYSKGENIMKSTIYEGLSLRDICGKQLKPNYNETGGFINADFFYPECNYTTNGNNINITFKAFSLDDSGKIVIDPQYMQFTTGIYMYYEFENNILDSSGNTHGSIEGPTYITGKLGNGTQFDGVNDIVNVTDFVDGGPASGTTAFWFKTNSNGGRPWGSSDTAGNDRYIATYIDTTLQIQIKDDGGTQSRVGGNVTVSDGSWHFGAITSNGTAYKIYVDGYENAKTVHTGSDSGDWFEDSTQRDNFHFGNLERNSGPINYYNGSLDEMAFWDVELNSSDILWLYNSGSGRYYEEVINYSLSTNFTEDIVLCLDFEQDAKDFFGRHNGTGTGNSYNEGKIDDASEFFESNDYVTITAHADLIQDSGSFSLWYNSDDAGQGPYGRLFDYAKASPNNGMDCYLHGVDGDIACYQMNSSKSRTLSFGNLVNDVWRHIVVTWNETNMRGYINGSAINETNDTLSNIDIPGQNMLIGMRDDYNRDFDGHIDEFILWGSELNSSQVGEIYREHDGVSCSEIYYSGIYVPSDVPSDTEYPSFYNVSFLPPNASQIGSGQLNVSLNITHTNGTAGWDFDGVNYSLSNTSTNHFNASNLSLGAGTYSYYFWAYGNGTSANYNTSITYSYTINESADTEYPLFYNRTEDPVNNSYGESKNLSLTINVTHTNGTVGVDFNGTNYSMFNTSGGAMFNMSNISIVNGTYSYYYWSYGNGTDANYNTSATYNYILNDLIRPVFGPYTDNNNSLNDSGMAIFNISYINNTEGGYAFSGLTYLEYDGENKSVDCDAFMFCNINFTETNGTYQYRWRSWGNGTNGGWGFTDWEYYTVGPDQQYPIFGEVLDNSNTFNKTGTGIFNVSWINNSFGFHIPVPWIQLDNETGVPVNRTPTCNSSYFCSYNTTLTTGSYDYMWCSKGNGSQELINCTQEYTFIVGSGDTEYPIFGTILDNNNTFNNSGTARLNITWITHTNGTIGISYDGTNVTPTCNASYACNYSFTETSGTYSYYWWAYGNGTDGNYNQSTTQSYFVGEEDTTPPTFDEYPSNASLTFGTSYANDINASDNEDVDGYFVNDTRFTMTRADGTLINNTALGVATYWINISVNDTSNNWVSAVIFINITKATGDVRAYLSGNRANQSTTNNSLNYNFSTQLYSGEGTHTMRINGTNWNSGTSTWLNNLSNLSYWGITTINITASFTATQNYTADTETWWLTITEFLVAQVTPCSNRTVLYNNPFLPKVINARCVT